MPCVQPEWSKRREQTQRARVADDATRYLRQCSYCPGLFSVYKNAWKIHEGKCKGRLQTGQAGSRTGTSSHGQSNLGDLEGSGNLEGSEGSEDDLIEEDDYWDGFGAGTLAQDIDSTFQSDAEGCGSEPEMPTPKTPEDQPGNQGVHTDEVLPPRFPFKTHEDFVQAEIFSDFGNTDKHINRQLALASPKVYLKNAKDYHQTLALVIRLWGGEFTSKRFITNFEGQDFEHYVHFQPVFPALVNVVGDPDLAKYMVYYPEEKLVHRPGTDNEPMQMWEELWHGKLWWMLQSRVRPNQCVLYIVIYIDETSVSTIGGVNVWPIYAWIGNLPASVRKRRTKKGGAILLGYLPKASNARKESKVKDLAGFRCQVYHDALRIVFESLRVPSQYGAPVRCGDGMVRELVPIVAAGSADYMEIIKMICILGHRSGFPCPICLVPQKQQSKLTQAWPLRTVQDTEAIMSQAEDAESPAEAPEILREQSHRSVRCRRHVLEYFSRYYPAHSFNLWRHYCRPVTPDRTRHLGKHLWPWIRDQLPTSSKETLDARVRSIPQYPDLKHFPNGITSLKYITGKEHAVILRLIGPLLEDLLLDKYQELILGTFRTLAIIHMFAKFTTYTDISLEELDQQIRKFDKLHAKLVKTFSELEANYPKFHSLSHLVNIIRQHSTTDNYHTGLGEALHPQSKKDYRRTNHQKDFEIQMLRMHQEREAVIRIRSRINSAKLQDQKGDDLDPTSSWDGPSVQLGAPDRSGRQPAPSFIQSRVQLDPEAKKMALHLRTFLYQQVGGFGNRTHFRESDLPHLDGTLVSIYRLITVGYTSFLDSRLGLDVVRITDSWRNQGPRHDFAIVATARETFVARLLQVFTLKARGEQHSIAYVHYFKIGNRSKTTGYIELTDTNSRNFIFTDAIMRSCVVISPGIKESTHVLWDLESPDMYPRLQHL